MVLIIQSFEAYCVCWCGGLQEGPEAHQRWMLNYLLAEVQVGAGEGIQVWIQAWVQVRAEFIELMTKGFWHP